MRLLRALRSLKVDFWAEDGGGGRDCSTEAESESTEAVSSSDFWVVYFRGMVG